MSMSEKLSNIKIKLNRLYAEKAALKHKIEKQESRTRKARTRTLIQMGGLLELTPLPALCEIQLGDDLQGEHQSKAALLLGIFAKYSEFLPEKLSEDEKQELETLGLMQMAKKENSS